MPLTKYVWNQTDLAKSTHRSPRVAGGEWDIGDLEKLTGMPGNTLRQYQIRKLWHPSNLESLALFLARYGKQELREALVRMTVLPAPKKPATPDSLRGAIEWLASQGDDDLKHRILRAAMSGGGRKRVKERPGKARAKGKK